MRDSLPSAEAGGRTSLSGNGGIHQVLPGPQGCDATPQHQGIPHPSTPSAPWAPSQCLLTWGVPLSPSCSTARPSSTLEHLMDLMCLNSAKHVGWGEGQSAGIGFNHQFKSSQPHSPASTQCTPIPWPPCSSSAGCPWVQ